MSWIDTHHPSCDGSECIALDCAGLPENIGRFREGSVIEVLADSSVVVQWSDGTQSTLRARKRPKSTHQHEEWQIRSDANGAPYCAACGAEVKGGVTND